MSYKTVFLALDWFGIFTGSGPTKGTGVEAFFFFCRNFFIYNDVDSFPLLG